MDLQISAFLLFSLFTAGHSLSCNQCVLGSCQQTTCPSESTNCLSTTVIYSTNNINKVRGCVPASLCVNGFVNYGSFKASSSCCNTDLCNSQDAPEPSIIPNGKKCYNCDGVTTKNCKNVLSCSGSEDRCFTGIVGQTVSKGCASKSYCDSTAVSSVNVGDVTCCVGNLCNGAQSNGDQSNGAQSNGAQSVSQSFLFLCCSLLSYFLLH